MAIASAYFHGKGDRACPAGEYWLIAIAGAVSCEKSLRAEVKELHRGRAVSRHSFTRKHGEATSDS